LSSLSTLSFLSSRGTLPFLSSRGTQVPRDPSLTLGATAHPVFPRHASAEGPLAYARCDKKVGSGRHPLPCHVER
jgi:hypothetical protein